MLSHRKYKELAEAFKTCVQDEKILEDVLKCVRDVTGYAEDKKTHGQLAYQKVRARRDDKGETSWTEQRKEHYQKNKAELNKKRMVYYHKKKEEEKKI